MTEDVKILFVQYCADDMLGGTLDLEPLTELAYRRICDMIYKTNDNLLDNDAALEYSTKTGKHWKKIKTQLIIDHEKIYVEHGRIRQRVCSEKLEDSRANIEQKSRAGKASAENRKSLENNDTGSTAVITAVPTAVPTNQEPITKSHSTPFPPQAVDKNPEPSGRKYSAAPYLTARVRAVAVNIVKNRSIDDLIVMFSDYVRSRDPPQTVEEAGRRFIGYCKKFAEENRNGV